MAAADREKALETALAQIERQFGKGSVMRLGDDDRPPIESFPTGSISLDIALGIGGLPRGRIVEIYGPESSGKSTLAMHAVASAQKSGIAAFVDAEHALDPEYAKKIGVNVDDLLLSQPDTGEQALEITDMLIRSGALSVIVIDSVAALVPRAEIEGEMGDSHVGLQARLMSQALRKISGALHQTGTTAIFINQLREKVGVMFGCMDADTPVTLADGGQERIRTIVDERRPVEVLSYDPDLDAVVPRKVVDWFDNGTTDSFLKFTVAASGDPGEARFTATPNHLVRTPGGWRQAGELAVGDRLLTVEPHYLTEQQRQLVYGSLLGNGTLETARDRAGAALRMRHGPEWTAYVDWKTELLGNIDPTRDTTADGAVSVGFRELPELRELAEIVHFGGARKHVTWELVKSLTPLALTVWYLDRGRTVHGRVEIDVAELSPGSRQRLAEYLRDTHGLDVRLVTRGDGQSGVLEFTEPASEAFHTMVAPYTPAAMEHLLPPHHRGRCAVRPAFAEPVRRLVAAPVLDISAVRPDGDARRFDIEVEGNHNYFVDGVMVHNSPETTTGGRALKFYSSVRLDVRRIETLKDGTDAVGNRTRVKVVKNKVASPFKQAEFDILYGVGISREGGLIDLGVEHGIVRKSGAWYTYEGSQLGQGKENARNFLREHPDTADEVEKKIKEKLGIPSGSETDTTAASGDTTASQTASEDTTAAPAAASTKRAGRGKTTQKTDE